MPLRGWDGLSKTSAYTETKVISMEIRLKHFFYIMTHNRFLLDFVVYYFTDIKVNPFNLQSITVNLNLIEMYIESH